MGIEEIIRTWKADEEALESGLPKSPVGRELDEHELLEVVGGCIETCVFSCDFTCSLNSCNFTCFFTDRTLTTQ